VLRAAKNQCLILDLVGHPEIAYLLFAEKASYRISRDLKNLCRLAKIHGAKIGLNPNSRLITGIIGPIETGLRETAEFRSYWLKKAKIML